MYIWGGGVLFQRGNHTRELLAMPMHAITMLSLIRELDTSYFRVGMLMMPLEYCLIFASSGIRLTLLALVMDTMQTQNLDDKEGHYIASTNI